MGAITGKTWAQGQPPTLDAADLDAIEAAIEAKADGAGAAFPDGAIPIFETRAQAVAWEAETGRRAATIEQP